MGIFRRLFFCLLLIFSGCSSGLGLNSHSNILENSYGNPVVWRKYPILVTIDSSMSLEEKNVIINSINTWNLLAETEIFIYEFRTNPNPSNNGVWMRTCNLELTETGTQTLGRINRFFYLDFYGQPVNIRFAEICILKNLEPSYRDIVTLHELGHALSLNHDLNPNSIMYLNALHREQVVEEQDIAFVKRLPTL